MAVEITATELKKLLDRNDPIVLIDVREPSEWAEGHIPGAIHIPLGTIPAKASTLDPNADIVLYCKAGMRSMRALQHLDQAGFKHLRSLKGGIMAWES